MARRILLRTTILVFFLFSLAAPGLAQKDSIAQVATGAVRSHMGLPPGVEVKFIEKKESPAPGFYSVKLSLVTPDKEVPIIVYVDKAGERVFLGTLIVKGENVTRKEIGEPKARQVSLSLLEMEKSPFRGPVQAKVTIVEFSNFQCSYCFSSWKKMKGLLEKYPRDIRYVFKHFPLQPQGKTRDLSELVAAAQMVSHEAFWAIHDFFFSDEGHAIVDGDKEPLRLRIEIILKQRGFDVKAFQTALNTLYGKTRVDQDVAVGNKIGVKGTPSAVINGNFVTGVVPENTIEKYLGKKS